RRARMAKSFRASSGMRIPQSFGPRCTCVSSIRSTAATMSAVTGRSTDRTPAIPHILRVEPIRNCSKPRQYVGQHRDKVSLAERFELVMPASVHLKTERRYLREDVSERQQ